MKDRVREALFNLLGPAVRGKHALDLFAGTGALGLEAISRGAAAATLVERHLPTARLIEQNARALGIESRCQVVSADTFAWIPRQSLEFGRPWVVFCSPPYDFYVNRGEAMLALLNDLVARSPQGSLFAVESDRRFEPGLLPQADRWDVRSYPPAVVAIYEQPIL